MLKRSLPPFFFNLCRYSLTSPSALTPSATPRENPLSSPQSLLTSSQRGEEAIVAQKNFILIKPFHARSCTGKKISCMKAPSLGIIILYQNKFHPFDFTAELKAGRNYTPGPSSAELGAATKSALSYLRPAFHSAFVPLLLWWLKTGIWGIFKN